MIPPYDFLAPPRIVFGWGRRSELGPLAGTLGRRACVVLGSRTLQQNGTWNDLAERLQQAGIESILAASIAREPEIPDVDALVERLRQHGVGAGDFLLAL